MNVEKAIGNAVNMRDNEFTFNWLSTVLENDANLVPLANFDILKIIKYHTLNLENCTL